ncbi:MAG: hypothetical protein ABF810_04740, partial [Gluconobacter cerinus]
RARIRRFTSGLARGGAGVAYPAAGGAPRHTPAIGLSGGGVRDRRFRPHGVVPGASRHHRHAVRNAAPSPAGCPDDGSFLI